LAAGAIGAAVGVAVTAAGAVAVQQLTKESPKEE
jgi:hypothetical protein